jgi:hypothetical protein
LHGYIACIVVGTELESKRCSLPGRLPCIKVLISRIQSHTDASLDTIEFPISIQMHMLTRLQQPLAMFVTAGEPFLRYG